MHLNGKISEKLIFLKTVEALVIILTWYNGPIELEFHVKTPYDKLAKIYAKYFGHMTKMATTPIYGKKHLKIFFSRTRRLMTLRLGM